VVDNASSFESFSEGKIVQPVWRTAVSRIVDPVLMLDVITVFGWRTNPVPASDESTILPVVNDQKRHRGAFFVTILGTPSSPFARSGLDTLGIAFAFN